MTKKKITAKSQGTTIDSALGIRVSNRMYYPLPQRPKVVGMDAMHPVVVVAIELNPCATIADNKPCPNIPGCVCKGGQCFYTLSQLRKRGFNISQ
jgi:hypothetical protein